MISKQYFAAQAATLLKLAGLSTNAQASAALTSKAAELQEKIVEPSSSGLSPHPPDVDRPT